MNPTTRLSAAALALAAGLASASATAAQETTGGNALRPGASSLVVGVSPEASVGYRRMVSGRTSLGVVGSVQGFRNSQRGTEARRTYLVVSPEVKRYRSTDGAILPYLHGGVFASVVDFGTRTPGTSDDDRTTVLGGSVGAGLDWFPVRRISLGGHAGLGLQRQSSEIERPQGSSLESTSWLLQTFTAAIQVQLFL